MIEYKEVSIKECGFKFKDIHILFRKDVYIYDKYFICASGYIVSKMPNHYPKYKKGEANWPGDFHYENLKTNEFLNLLNNCSIDRFYYHCVCNNQLCFCIIPICEFSVIKIIFQGV